MNIITEKKKQSSGMEVVCIIMMIQRKSWSHLVEKNQQNFIKNVSKIDNKWHLAKRNGKAYSRWRQHQEWILPAFRGSCSWNSKEFGSSLGQKKRWKEKLAIIVTDFEYQKRKFTVNLAVCQWVVADVFSRNITSLG